MRTENYSLVSVLFSDAEAVVGSSTLREAVGVSPKSTAPILATAAESGVVHRQATDRRRGVVPERTAGGVLSRKTEPQRSEESAAREEFASWRTRNRR